MLLTNLSAIAICYDVWQGEMQNAECLNGSKTC